MRWSSFVQLLSAYHQSFPSEETKKISSLGNSHEFSSFLCFSRILFAISDHLFVLIFEFACDAISSRAIAFRWWPTCFIYRVIMLDCTIEILTAGNAGTRWQSVYFQTEWILRCLVYHASAALKCQSPPSARQSEGAASSITGAACSTEGLKPPCADLWLNGLLPLTSRSQAATEHHPWEILPRRCSRE